MESNVTRKIPISELFSKTYTIYKVNFIAIILAHLIVYIPYYILYFFISNLSFDNYFQIPIEIMRYVISLLTGIANLATVYIVDNTLNGRPTITFGQSMQLAYKKWGVSITSGFLMYAIQILLTLLLIIPGVIWMIYYVFFYQVIALTGLSGKKALDYSKYIVKGYWWKVFGSFLGLTSIPLLIYFGGLYRLYNYLVAIDPGLKILSIFLYTVFALLLSFATVGITILYRNLESIKPEAESEITFYEKVNRMVNRDESDYSLGMDDEIENEPYDEDDNALRCSVCGIRVDDKQLICPVCHSVIRHDPEIN